MQVIISNSVPLNGGDEALLEATVFGLNRTFSSRDLKITALTNDPILARKFVKNYKFDWDLEYTKPRFILKRLYFNARKIISSFFRPNLSSFDGIPGLFAYFRIRALYRDADLVLVCPGGYFHDFYDFRDRLNTIKSALAWSKKVVLFGHSIGPFWKPHTKEALKETLGAVSMIILREQVSKDHLIQLGLRTDHVFVHSDIAFVLSGKLAKVIPRVQNPTKTSIVVNFRSWGNHEETTAIVEKGILLCRFLLSSGQNTLVFLSTCQGISSYHDDSFIAKGIFANMDSQEKKRCTIISRRFTPEQFMIECASHNCYIGMRLHGAILSMMSGVPAFNIGYEDKTEGIYSAIDLSKYQVHYSLPFEEWLKRIRSFLLEVDQIKGVLPSTIDKVSSISWAAFDRLRN